MRRKKRNNAINDFEKDLANFTRSAAGFVPGLGTALGIYDTYERGGKLTKSTQRAIKAVKRKVKTRINRTSRRLKRSFGYL